ncbi:hypothetical protein H7E67_10720 [Clostridium gasigenes]|uniref:hypothetical protein n=1 Tax=Clostridium gasigenes TaxID=94869 RepID=UPI00143834ED|nr:hypothetical protein [Clostridium gasigenes]MBB6623900.1 hypothetical protein [Clostridium gasigenes]NKF05421.1 hypothetical protein [Clostridium gasigenes]QSW18867.1 hypothetical protein J1C67_15165 [Clostridium gasigenes]
MINKSDKNKEIQNNGTLEKRSLDFGLECGPSPSYDRPKRPGTITENSKKNK